MDNTIILYLIKASISIAIFYGIYMLCLRADTFLRLRRFYFLFAIIFSLVFPTFNVKIPIEDQTPAQIPTFWLSDLSITPEMQDQTQSASANLQNIILISIFIISAFCVARFLIQLLSIIKLRSECESEKMQKYRIVKMRDKQLSPFSFFNWIFVNTEDKDAHRLKEIIAHEQAHARQYHSIDNLLAELLCAFLWWNPFAWLIKKEIKVNLEYLADREVLNQGYDSREYQYILLQVSNKNSGVSLINNFNVSQLKKRITMMNKRKSSMLASLKYLLIVPIGAMLLLSNAAQASPDLITMASNEIFDRPQDEVDQFPSFPGGVDASYAIPITFKLNNAQPVGEVKNNNVVAIGYGKQDPTVKTKDAKYTSKNGIFVTVEQMPRFPGGEVEMQRYIRENLKYPETAQNGGIEGRVVLRFIVGDDGSITYVTVIRGLDPDCNAEAVRVIESMPKWTPGKQNNIAVPVYFNLPIQFKLTKDKTGDKPAVQKR